MKTLKHLFMLGLFEMISLAASAAVYSGSCGINAKWSLDTSTGLLSITGSGKMRDCTYSSRVPWDKYRNDIISLSIGDQITSIGDVAFYGCSGLTSVTIPNSVTEIGESAFENCSGLTSVTIPDSVTSIGSYAFSSCSGLTSVKIPNSVTTIRSYAFYCCKGLTSVTIPNSVTSIGSNAFGSCLSLTSIVVESGNTVYDSRGNCNAIIETTSNTLISGCKSTEIPNSVTSIGREAFYGCSGLTSVTIPNSVTEIGESAFWGCYFLSGKFVNNSSLNAESNNYWGATICDIRTDDGLCIKDNIVVKYCGNGTSTSVTIPNSVTSIGSSAFSGCSGLTSIEIPNSVISIDYNAFFRCSGLTSVTIPNSVTSIGKEAFDGCYFQSGEFVNNSSLDAESNNYWGATICDIRTDDGLCIKDNIVVKYCGNGTSTSVTIPNSVTSIDEYAFYSCNNVKELIYAEGTKTVLRTGLTSITSVTIPNSVTSIGREAFYGCSGLTNVKVHWKRPLSIDSSVWSGVDKQKCTLYVPEGTWMMYCAAPAWMDFVNIEEFSDEPGEEIYLTIMGVNGVILQQAVETGKTYKYLLDNKKNGKIVSVTFNGEDVTADVTDGKYTTPKITGNSEIYVEYDNQPLGDTNLDGTVNVNDITKTAEIILLRAKAEMEAKAAMEADSEP